MKPGSRLTLALTVSLALNLFLAGALLGGWLNREPGGIQPVAAEMAPEFSVGEFMQSLPAAARDETERAIAAHRDEMARRIAALRGARVAVAASLSGRPFDGDAVNASFAELRRRNQEIQSVLHSMMGNVAARLGPADRAHLARGMFLFSRLPGEERLAIYEVPLM